MMMYISQLKKKRKQNCFWTKVTANLMLSAQKMTYICHEVKSLQT